MKSGIVWVLLLSAGLTAGEKVAIAVKSQGTVDRVLAETKATEPLKRGIGLVDEDLIRTGKDGFAAAMYLDDRTTVKVRSETEFLIGGIRTAAGINKRVYLSHGSMFAQVSKQTGREFIIATPVSVASVKGTDVITISDPVVGDLFITLVGSIEITNNISGEKTAVGAGQSASSTPKGDLVVTTTQASDIPDFGEGPPGTAPRELRFEIEDADGNAKGILIKYR